MAAAADARMAPARRRVSVRSVLVGGVAVVGERPGLSALVRQLTCHHVDHVGHHRRGHAFEPRFELFSELRGNGCAVVVVVEHVSHLFDCLVGGFLNRGGGGRRAGLAVCSGRGRCCGLACQLVHILMSVAENLIVVLDVRPLFPVSQRPVQVAGGMQQVARFRLNLVCSLQSAVCMLQFAVCSLQFAV